MRKEHDDIRAAEPGDDAALRRLLRETPLPGGISVTLEREPSFFGADVDVIRHDTVWLDGAGCGSRLLKRAWWNGEETDVAYCADLRVHPQERHRSGRLLRHAFEGCDAMQARYPAAVTWTAVFEENIRARRILESGRNGLPVYEDRGRLLCPALLAFPGKRLPKAGAREWEEIADFINAHRRDRPLAPVVDAESFANGERWPGLRAEDVLMKRENGKIRGVVGLHDVRHCRQIRIHGVPGWLQRLRGPSRLLAGLGLGPVIPAVGEVMPLAYASFLTAESVTIARELLRAAAAEAARRGLGFVMTAVHEHDPFVPALRGLPRVPFAGRLYEIHRGKPVAWPAGVPLVEAAAL